MRNDILFGIIITLLNEGKCTYNQLAEKFEVCKKTIQRYMTALEMAGIPTISYYGRSGGTEIAGTFNLENLYFSKQEVARMLAHLKSSPLKDLDSTDTRIEEKLNFVYEKKPITKQDNFIINYSSWGYSQTITPIIKLLSEKISSKHTYEITYINSSGTTSKRIVSPYKIIFKDFKWYLYAYCHSKKQPRVFKLNRIQTLVQSEEEFVPNPLSDTEIIKNLDNVFGLIEIQIQSSTSLLPDLEEWLKITKIEPISTNQITLTGLATNSDNLTDKILSYGEKVKLIKPASLVSKIQDYCKTLIKHYSA